MIELHNTASALCSCRYSCSWFNALVE